MMRAWCGTCRSMSVVMDEYDTEDRQGRTYVAQPLDCGHNGTDGGHKPPRARARVDAHLVARLVDLQDAARQGKIA